MKITNKIAGIFFLALLTVSCSICQPRSLLTGLEKSRYLRLTSLLEISGFFSELAHRSNVAKKVIIGKSVLGNSLEALLVSKEMNRFQNDYSSGEKMTVMLIGAQHGMEPSGAEALLLLARDIVEGKLSSCLEYINFIIISVSNPDGRNANLRGNGNRVNLSTNFIILSEPETKAIYNVLYRWKPEVILDVHESAVLKKKTLGKQGYLINFEAQFEAANNPNVDSRIRSLSFECLLPEVIALVNAQGLHAQHYIGEITDMNQTITHGGLSLRNLRNMGGMMGSFSFLLENRLDLSTGTYPTPRNIRERVAKQYLSIASFLRVCQHHRAEIINLTREARTRWNDQKHEDPLYLSFTYATNPSQPMITFPLRKRDTNELVEHSFNYQGMMIVDSALPIPLWYLIISHQEVIKAFLDRHHIAYEIEVQPRLVPVTIQKVFGFQTVTKGKGQNSINYSVAERVKYYRLKKGDLLVSLNQPARRLIPLFLELKSVSSIFNFKEYSRLVKKNKDFFIYRVYSEEGRLLE